MGTTVTGGVGTERHVKQELMFPKSPRHTGAVEPGVMHCMPYSRRATAQLCVTVPVGTHDSVVVHARALEHTADMLIGVGLVGTAGVALGELEDEQV